MRSVFLLLLHRYQECSRPSLRPAERRVTIRPTAKTIPRPKQASGCYGIPGGDEVFQTYLRAKAEADQALRQSGLDYTIVRPGRLTNKPGCGLVSLAASLPRGEIPRADVAAVIAHVLDTPTTVGCQFDVTSGEQEIVEAVAEVTSLRNEAS